MRVKWSRDLDLPSARRDSPKSAEGHRKRKGFLRIFSFLDRKSGARTDHQTELPEEESSSSGTADSARRPEDGRKSSPPTDGGKKRRRRSSLFRRPSEEVTQRRSSSRNIEEGARGTAASPTGNAVPSDSEPKAEDSHIPQNRGSVGEEEGLRCRTQVLSVHISRDTRSKTGSSADSSCPKAAKPPTFSLPVLPSAIEICGERIEERKKSAAPLRIEEDSIRRVDDFRSEDARRGVIPGSGGQEEIRRLFDFWKGFAGGREPTRSVGKRESGLVQPSWGDQGRREEEGGEGDSIRSRCRHLPPEDPTGSGPKPVKQPASTRINKQQQQEAPVWTTRVELAKEICRLGTLCESRTKELTHLKMRLRHASLGFDAFSVLFQYLTEELDVFSQTRLVSELEKTRESLIRAEEQLKQYKSEFEELKIKHSGEFSELANKLNETYREVVEELTLKHAAEIQELKNVHEQQLAEMSENHTKQYLEAKEKHTASLIDLECSHRQQIEDMKRSHMEELEEIEYNHRQARLLLSDQLKELEQQCKDLKHQAKLVEEALQRDTDTKIQWISAKKADLEKEVDSLKTVLDMKRNEIHALRKENLEMKKELEKLPAAKEKIKMLQAKAEDLQALVNEKVQKERQLSCDHENLKESYEKESKVNKRLSMENEELLWKLKQTAEANFLNSLSGSPEVFEKLFSPLKSPNKQSVSLPPIFFRSIDESSSSSASAKETSLPNVLIPKNICKKPPLSPRKCSSPVRTPSFVAATPAIPCSRRCKAESKNSPRKQKQKSQIVDKNKTMKDLVNSDESLICAKSSDKHVNNESVIQNGIPVLVKDESMALEKIHYYDELAHRTNKEQLSYKLLDFKDFVESDKQENLENSSSSVILPNDGSFSLTYCQHTVCSFSEEESSNDSDSKNFLFDDDHIGEQEQSEFGSLFQREEWSFSLPRNQIGEATIDKLSPVVDDQSLEPYALEEQARVVRSQQKCGSSVADDLDSNNLDTSCKDFLSKSEKTT